MWKSTIAHNATFQTLIEILRQHEHTAEVIKDLEDEFGKMKLHYLGVH